MKLQNIILIGFMGVGKGTLARELTRRSNYIAVDSDDLIESFENRKIKTIFRDEGEAYFRNLERKIADWLANHVENTIISTGGGFFAVENLNKIGKVVYLKSDFEAILKRILNHPKAEKKIKKRPLLQDSVKAKELFDHREPLYAAKADITVSVAGRSPADIAEEILKYLRV
jgi:shikimate kinase